MLKICTFFLAVLFLTGCSNTLNEDQQDIIITYKGIYLYNYQINNIGTRVTDSLALTLVNGSSYTFRFFDITQSDVNFCTHTGILTGFQSNRVVFSPKDITYMNCDTLNLPEGVFVGDFVTRGDTIVIEQLNGDTLKRITLLK